MNDYDPFSFGAPPPDAVDDEFAMEGLMGGAEDSAARNFQPNNAFLEDNQDIPRVDDANPFKDPSGMQKRSPGVDESMSGEMGAPEPMDQEALQQAILDAAAKYNASSAAYQDNAMQGNEDEALDRMKFDEGM